MWRQGALKAWQLRGSFQMLRSQDLIWFCRVTNHLLCERLPSGDLMAWNAGGTRLPYRLHCEFLHSLFLHNALARGQAGLDGRPIKLADIRVPIFKLGALRDHVALWRTVFKLHTFTDAERTFAPKHRAVICWNAERRRSPAPAGPRATPVEQAQWHCPGGHSKSS